jgi:hypothetical protein
LLPISGFPPGRREILGKIHQGVQVGLRIGAVQQAEIVGFIDQKGAVGSLAEVVVDRGGSHIVRAMRLVGQ